MKTVIFVCHGSICRSPAAAFIAKQYLKEQGRDDDFNILIRATSSEEIGNDIYPPMRRELIRRGVPLYPHAAQRISQRDYENADYIFCMDDENYYSLLRQLDNHKSIIYRINKFTKDVYEIEDPWYTGRYELVCDLITKCIHDIFSNIQLIQMFIKNNPELREELNKIISINAINMNVADMLMTAFSYTDIIDPQEIKQYIKEGWEENAAILELLYDFYQLDKNNDDNQNIMNSYILKNIKCLNPQDYQNNPYVKAINKTGRNKKYALKYINYHPYQLFAYDDIKMNGYQENSHIGYFKDKFSYLALTEGNNIWMSLNPNEIETMKPFISKGRGDVLVLGLGMGYVPFMLASKNCVKSVTIIEKDQNIIDLFNEFIWPSFINKEKITIIKDDAIEYVKRQKEATYDYIFADLWHDPEDGLPLFVSLKKSNKDINCWLDASMYALLRRCMITLLEETLNGSKEEDYRFAKTYTDKVINTFYQKTKNLSIERLNDLDVLLDNDNLLSLLL